MANVPSESEIIDAARPLVAAGVALHWLKARSKRPVGDPAKDGEEWGLEPVHTLETLTAAYRRGYNIGVRPGEFSKTPWGYLHLLDIDVRDPDQAEDAWKWLLERWPEAREAPYVISGSGGASEHRYFFTDKPFRSRKLAHSAGFAMVFDAKKQREVKKRDWEIEIYGTGKQVVLPPSIHPDTGNPYTWGRPIDFDLLDLGVGPILAAEIIEAWGVSSDESHPDEDDDLFLLMRAEPMGLSEAEIEAAVAGLPPEWVEDRDCWLTCGQALHHEYQGGAPGFERWCEWSKRSAKFDIQDQKRVWKSFRESGRRQPVRMASLIKASADYALDQAHADMDDLIGTSVAVIPPAGAGDTTVDDLADLLGPVAPPTPSAPGASLVYDPEWRSHLQRNEEGVIKPTLPNVQLIVRNDIRTRGVIAFNEFTQEIVLLRSPARLAMQKASPKPIRQLEGAIWDVRDALNGDMWTDSHDHSLRAVLEAPERQGGYGLKTSDRDLRAAVDMVAHENAFHPVRHYLDGLIWDGVPRVERLFIDYVGSEDTAYHREAAMLFLLGAVTRIFEPGHKFDFVPILEGLQGKRKSTFIRLLGLAWSCELEGDFQDSKSMVEKMQGAWICEIPELQGFSKAEVTTLKGFISRVCDKIRMAFEKRARPFPRQCVFMGSTNEVEYLRDSTGGRRFWPIACNVAEIDTDRLSREVDQIWAEARDMYGRWRGLHPFGDLPLYLRHDESAAEAKVLQESRRAESVDEVVAGRISHWLEEPIGSDLGLDHLDGETLRYRDRVCLPEIWHEMMGQDLAKYDSKSQQMLGRAMRLLPSWRLIGQSRTEKYGKQRIFARAA